MATLLLASCGGSEEARYERSCLRYGKKHIEPRLKDVVVDEESLAPRIKSMLVTNESIVGKWEDKSLLSSVSFLFKKRKDGDYNVLFHTGGCVGRWSLKRKATFNDGILKLNKPVEEYCSDPYIFLYMIRMTNGVRLAKQPLIRDLLSGDALGENQCDGKISFSEFLILRGQSGNLGIPEFPD